jgi:putative ABC transport system ATP-binding protein
MLRKGLSYGWLAARRRIREMVLPVVTTATGAFLVVIVFGMSEGIRAQSASLGHADEIGRAVVLIAVTVLLVGVVEVAVATTRTVAHRTRELGVLGANGVPRTPVVAALLVESVIAAVLGAVVGALLAAVTGIVLGAVGLVATGVSVEGLTLGAAISVGVSIVAALATSIVPTWNAASRPPIRSLTAGGLKMTAIDETAEATIEADSQAPVIEISDVWKLHKLGDEVVRALVAAELQVMPGEFVCLMGPSGSGKSTLLNIIGGLDRPTKGSVKLTGRDTSLLTESQFAALRHDTIGFIFQSYNLIPFLTAVENVELPLMFEPYDRKSLRTRAIELLELVGLGHRIHHQPTKMSGGEQQRTAIARSLISNPTLVLADEPTANLDHRTGETVVRMLRDLCSTLGVTVVASTHDPTVADEATRVVRMKDGQIVN